ncbi:hypothetical protein Ate02nite_52520 [Paractinoplanes tereljensis]|uniref:Uncharacterized protein n=1 Tax=Paractinoplanes tereljensis TaxID=571912 RepID=A0A919TW32_9ACTN|nr:hypothetical protein Ate02nite_52520 [Actinoplanes tereljensis]
MPGRSFQMALVVAEPADRPLPPGRLRQPRDSGSQATEAAQAARTGWRAGADQRSRAAARTREAR